MSEDVEELLLLLEELLLEVELDELELLESLSLPSTGGGGATAAAGSFLIVILSFGI